MAINFGMFLASIVINQNYDSPAITGNHKRIFTQVSVYNSSSNENTVILKGLEGHPFIKVVIQPEETVSLLENGFKWIQSSSNSSRIQLTTPTATVATPLHITISYVDIN
jgi:hypothetical protein